MTTACVDPNLDSNLQLLQKQSLKVEFHLDHTDYKKVENIGTGAYGVVCSAINRKTRQRVAIKKIPNLFTMDPRYAIRTYREIKILQHFKHGNIIAIREILQPVNKDLSDIYVVMDLMESDLHRIIYSKQSLTDEHVQYFLYQILRGLKYIHSAHVIHRDLKPSNLLVNADCELKIGDFGMARGINFKADKANQQMTQYVATRWYRAPELIVAGRQGYGPAIDIWSVGCIFAEMLRRKHLFPGRDLLNQLTVIFRTLGIPSKHYLQHLDSETVCGFIRKITESEEFKPKSCAELCPKASRQAIDLLSKMLVIEPEKRINVETALTHPFLSKYHDKKQEPNCIKKFDFAFEQELVNMENDDQKRVGIQELLKKEVLSYRKPQPIDFGALITSKSVDTSQTDDPYADLDAFLAQLASPAKVTSPNSSSHNALLAGASRPSANPLLAGTKPTNSLLESNKPTNTLGNSLLGTEAHKKNFLLVANTSTSTKKGETQNSLLLGQDAVKNSINPPIDSQATKQPNALLDQANPVPFQPSHHNPLLSGSKSNQLAGAAEPSHTKTDTQSENIGSDIPFMSNIVVPTTSESDQSNDTELFDNLFKKVKTEAEEADELTVNTRVAASTDDIEMISAQLGKTDIAETKPKIPEEKPDTKSILRQRLIDKQNTTGQAKVQDKAPGKASITAHQRQKEREERRKKKREKAQEKKRNKKKETAGQLLTSEDQKMLDRWRQMAKPQHIQPKPNSTIVSTGGKNLIVVYPATGSTTYISSNISSTGSNATPAAAHRTTSDPAYSSQQAPPIQLPTNTVTTKQQHASCPTNPVISKQMQPAVRQLSAHQANPSVMNHQINSQPNPQQQSMSQLGNPQMVASRSHQMPMNQPMTNKMHTTPVINHTSTHQMQLSHSTINAQPSTNAQNPSVVHSVPPGNDFLNSNVSQTQSHPIRSFSDMAALHGNAYLYPDQAQETSLYDYNQPAANNVYGGGATIPLRAPEPANQNAEQFSNWTNTMSVNISLDMGHPEPKGEEGLPPMLVSTPKGTGGGYGVGFDMESMMAYNPDLQNMHMDSAPLSASLLADWMDVTSTMDPKALDDIQRELELNDFPFSY